MKNSLGRKDVKEFVKVVVSAKDQKVIGFHMSGSESSEIMQARSMHCPSLESAHTPQAWTLKISAFSNRLITDTPPSSHTIDCSLRNSNVL